jgi:hypothetical protein
MTISKNFGFLLLTGLLTPACVLLGVEPDEIGDGSEASGYSAGSIGDGDGDNNGQDESDTGAQGDGDGDGEPGDGDGDGEPGDGDGDGDPTGDGDGESTDTGDGDPGDGDGDGDTGDGDGDLVPCESLDPIPLEEADNQIIIPDVMSSFEGSCGGSGPEAVFSFTATIDADYDFSIWGDGFDGIIYLVDETCVPLDEIECSTEPQSIVYPMVVGQVVYIIADTDNGPGAAQLTIAPI